MAEQEQEQAKREREIKRANAALYDSFITPRDLRTLFLDTKRVARNWIEAILHHNKHMPVGHAERQMFFLGEKFNEMLTLVISPASQAGVDAWWPFALVAIVVFLFNSAPARVRLRNQDVAFLNGEGTHVPNARSLMDQFLLGRMPNGELIRNPADAHVNHVVSFAVLLVQVYRAHWLFDPYEEKALLVQSGGAAVLCKALN